jgi:hypothetical protein
MFSEDEKSEARTRMADFEHLGERSSHWGSEDAELFFEYRSFNMRFVLSILKEQLSIFRYSIF